MCTIAWGRRAGRLWIAFNRDEQRTRPAAADPRMVDGPFGPVVFARDPEGGGTWLAASLRGFAVALLNRYPDTFPGAATPVRSRGLLVTELAMKADPAAAAGALRATGAAPYRPFYLLILGTDGDRGFVWDGDGLEARQIPGCFLTTSSFEPERIAALRHRAWEAAGPELRGDPEAAARLMRETRPEDPAAGLTMDRDDARTVSQTRLILEPGHLKMSYAPREGAGGDYRETGWQLYPNGDLP
jgi:hypothetical protein